MSNEAWISAGKRGGNNNNYVLGFQVGFVCKTSAKIIQKHRDRGGGGRHITTTYYYYYCYLAYQVWY